MKALFLFFFAITNSSVIFSQGGWTDKSRILPDELRDLPTGIVIYHNPTPVWPEINTDTIDYPGKYIWRHSTTVQSMVGDLIVIKAGSYVWWKDRGWLPNVDLDRPGFSSRFGCKNARLLSGRKYIFLKNYRHGDNIYAGDALWFVLAKDKNGVIYKGIAIVETEGEVKINHIKPQIK